MRTGANGSMSFKKGGRLEAALIRWQTNDLVVLACRAGNLTIASDDLSDADRSYVARASGTAQSVHGQVEQSSLVRNEMTRRRREAAQLRDEAAEAKQLAQDELVAAKDLEKQASQLDSRPAPLGIQFSPPAEAAKGQGFCSKTTAGSNVALIAAGASDQLQRDITQRRLQAQQKRNRAAALQKQADQLEATAQAEEQNCLSGPSIAQ